MCNSVTDFFRLFICPFLFASRIFRYNYLVFHSCFFWRVCFVLYLLFASTKFKFFSVVRTSIVDHRHIFAYRTKGNSLILSRSKLNGAAEKKIAAYSCFWPQNQSDCYFDLRQKHEKTSPQNEFSRLVMTGTILFLISLD